MSDRYPHECPHCGGECYITGMEQVECSNSSCEKWDKKEDFNFDSIPEMPSMEQMVGGAATKVNPKDHQHNIDWSVVPFCTASNCPDQHIGRHKHAPGWTMSPVNPIGNPHYQHPNPGADTADPADDSVCSLDEFIDNIISSTEKDLKSCHGNKMPSALVRVTRHIESDGVSDAILTWTKPVLEGPSGAEIPFHTILICKDGEPMYRLGSDHRGEFIDCRPTKGPHTYNIIFEG